MFERRDGRVVRLISSLEEQLKATTILSAEYREKYFELVRDIRQLERENALFRQMFDDADNTSVIKYNGKLFKITDTSHFKSEDCPDTLSIDAVVVYQEDE